MATFEERQLEEEQISFYYLKGYSCAEIKKELNISLSVRHIQRLVRDMGINRTREQAYRLSVEKGKVGGPKKNTKINRIKIPPVLRYSIFERDNFRCKICGANADDRLLEVDHIDFDTRNNNSGNLRVLCEWCNFGRRPNSKNILLPLT